METLFSLMLGMSLSAACGFRIFVPMLAMSIAAQSGHLTLASGFEWIGTPEAFVAFAVAAILEVGGYYIPWLDNLLDTIATPTAIVAGTIVTASAVGEVSPLVQWTLAVILGGGAAGVTQGMTDVLRIVSTSTTGGFANPLLSTMELGTAATLSGLAITVPALAGILVIGLLFFAIQKILKFMQKRRRASSPGPSAGL
ncbi:DUF4126 domain-containing protein [Oscillatoria sp. FACHB-1407]|uniref:DUF4126 domain-containing protein n=1 Tax=Oscillatoria sp. FACHB-1407 TaxID=2692847 RepID=UPI0018EFD8EE|nr:DUF4126 domain-containing protein [Oscillatoria sp. FACHB-1407]